MYHPCLIIIVNHNYLLSDFKFMKKKVENGWLKSI